MLIHSTQVIVFAIFRNQRTITIWKNKKVMLPMVQTNMIIQGLKIPY